MAVMCNQCGRKTVLASSVVFDFGVDEEPYEDGIVEEAEVGEIVYDEVDVHIQYCEECNRIVSGWLDCETPHKSAGINAISAERWRQEHEEGYVSEHDDQWTDEQLIWAAVSYLIHDTRVGKQMPEGLNWPWDKSFWKPEDTKRNLVKAGALIAAEIDRLIRLEEKDELS